MCLKKIKVKVNCIMDIPHRKSIGTSRSMLPQKQSNAKKLNKTLKKQHRPTKCKRICTHNAIAVGQWIWNKNQVYFSLLYRRNKIIWGRNTHIHTPTWEWATTPMSTITAAMVVEMWSNFIADHFISMCHLWSWKLFSNTIIK